MSTASNSNYLSAVVKQAEDKIHSLKQSACKAFERKKDIDVSHWKRTVRDNTLKAAITDSRFHYQRLLKLLVHFHIIELILQTNPTKMILNAIMCICMMYADSGIQSKVFTTQVNNAYESLKSHFLFGMLFLYNCNII